MKVTVVGAGAVGASCAEYIAIKDFASEVVLIDIKEGFAEGKAMDLMQSLSEIVCDQLDEEAHLLRTIMRDVQSAQVAKYIDDSLGQLNKDRFSHLYQLSPSLSRLFHISTKS